MGSVRIGIGQGTAIYVGAILGAGILALPSLAAKEAGPASVLAWASLLLFCVPVATTFAALGGRYPDGGGVATFVAKAFGPRASAVVGYWFYFALPAGAPATAFVGGRYVADALNGGRTEALVIAAVLLGMAFTSNAFGLKISGRVQLALVGLLALLLLIACVAALPSARAANLHPFAPHGLWSVGGAASLLFFSFAGWEAVTHLSGEFRDPARDLRRVTVLTLVVVAVLYMGLSLTSVLVLGPGLADSPVPLSALLRIGVGGAASAITATVAALLSLGTMTVYLAGASRLGAALARDGALPRWLAKGHQAGEVPRRSLAVLGALSGVVALVALATGASLASVMLGASACFIAVTVAGLVAGTRLLPTGRPVWFGALAAAAVMGVVLVFSGWFLVVPLVLGTAALLYGRRARRPVPAVSAGDDGGGAAGAEPAVSAARQGR